MRIFTQKQLIKKWNELRWSDKYNEPYQRFPGQAIQNLKVSEFERLLLKLNHRIFTYILFQEILAPISLVTPFI